MSHQGYQLTSMSAWRMTGGTKFLALLSPLFSSVISASSPSFLLHLALVPGLGDKIGCRGRVQPNLWVQELIPPRLGWGIRSLRP